VAKITGLPTKDAERLDDANQPSGEGGSPSAWRIWQIPAQVASVNAVGARHGSEWTSRQLIPESMGSESSLIRSDCKLYFAEGAPARPSAEPTTDGVLGEFPEYLRCMLPPEGELAPDEVAKVEALVMEYWDIFMGPGDLPRALRI
jgi:hypothetical protein